MENNTNLILVEVVYDFNDWGLNSRVNDSGRYSINVVVTNVDDAASVPYLKKGCWGDISIVSVTEIGDIDTFERDAMIYIAENFMEKRESYII